MTVQCVSPLGVDLEVFPRRGRREEGGCANLRLYPQEWVSDYVLQVPLWDRDCAPQKVLKVSLSSLPGAQLSIILRGGSGGMVHPLSDPSVSVTELLKWYCCWV